MFRRSNNPRKVEIVFSVQFSFPNFGGSFISRLAIRVLDLCGRSLVGYRTFNAVCSSYSGLTDVCVRLRIRGKVNGNQKYPGHTSEPHGTVLKSLINHGRRGKF